MSAVSAANGTRTCCGGWQFVYVGIVAGHDYRLEWQGDFGGLQTPADMLVGHALWGALAADVSNPGIQLDWEYVCAEYRPGRACFAGTFTAPPGCSETLTVRATLRWAVAGTVCWTVPVVADCGPHSSRPPLRVAVVTGTQDCAHHEHRTVAARTAFYAGLTEAACAVDGARLLALPEICLQWHVPGQALDHAVAVPGRETERFAEIARRYAAVIVIGLLERDGDAVFNSAVVLDADGAVAGVYRKVHLASTEAISGVLPGAGFPVFDTAAGRLGCNICMDSSAAESARMVGLNGADFLVLPIMGDHRAAPWSRGDPTFDDERWRCIQRTRAMDNQLCMVIARNTTVGSCIIDRSGSVLAWNDGTHPHIVATVPHADGYRKWNGLCFREVNWRQRRPHLYGAFVAESPEALRRLRLG
jgi:predicted amidohydrolase